jgi:putative transposase
MPGRPHFPGDGRQGRTPSRGADHAAAAAFCNAVAERVIRTLRQECLDHVLIVVERHLQAVLQEYVAFYNTERPHRSLALEPPLLGGTARLAPPGPLGRVVARPVLGGLHHAYQRAA